MKTKQNVLLFNYKSGDLMPLGQYNTAAGINRTLFLAYDKFNNLIPADVLVLTTGQFRGEEWGKNLLYPNYCGVMTADTTLPTCDPTNSHYGLTDTMCMKLVREADEILKYLQEV